MPIFLCFCVILLRYRLLAPCLRVGGLWTHELCVATSNEKIYGENETSLENFDALGVVFLRLLILVIFVYLKIIV